MNFKTHTPADGIILGCIYQLKEILSSATILPVEESWEKYVHPVIKSVCPICKGKGEVQQTDIDWDICGQCSGTGQIIQPKQ